MTTNLVPFGQASSPESQAADLPSTVLDVTKRGESPILGSGTVYHGWVCSGPYFETVMYVYYAERVGPPRAPASTAAADQPVQVAQGSLSQAVPIVFELFDSDGFPCNRVEIYVEPGKVSAIDWDPFLGSCKFEAGMKHGHVVAKLPPGFRAMSRLISSHAGCFLGAPLMLTASTRAFAPITLSRDRFPMVVLVNHSAVEATVRGRLFCGKRTPENVWQIPANGTRILSIAHEFGDAIAIEPDEQVQTYLRMGVRGEYEVGVQCIERLQGPHESSVYLALG